MESRTLSDQLQRPLRDLRLSVTDRCNFRCTYCMPKEVFGDDYSFLPSSEQLTFEEITRAARLFASLGVKKLRLTGGEPLMRRDLAKLVHELVQIEGIEDIGLTTNGLLLKSQAQALYDAGLRRLNISLDALDPQVFAKMNGRGIAPDEILANMDLAHRMGFKIKVNTVIQKGVNEQEMLPLAAYFKERGIMLCFIEFMDVGNDNGWSFAQVVTKREMFDTLHAAYELEPVDPHYYGEVAKRYRYKGTLAEVGFITSVSESFCSTCTRARLSSDGSIYSCLFSSKGYSIRDMLRGDYTDSEIIAVIRQVWEGRADRYSDERTEQTARNRKKINMSYIGG